MCALVGLGSLLALALWQGQRPVAPPADGVVLGASQTPIPAASPEPVPREGRAEAVQNARTDPDSRRTELSLLQKDFARAETDQERKEVIDRASAWGFTEADLHNPLYEKPKRKMGDPMSPEEEEQAMAALRRMADDPPLTASEARVEIDRLKELERAAPGNKAISDARKRLEDSIRSGDSAFQKWARMRRRMDDMATLTRLSSSESIAAAIRTEITRTDSFGVRKDLYQVLGLTPLDSNRRFLLEEFGRESDPVRLLQITAALGNLENKAREAGVSDVTAIITRYETITDPLKKNLALEIIVGGSLPKEPRIRDLLWSVLESSPEGSLRERAAVGLASADLDEAGTARLLDLGKHDRDPKVRLRVVDGLQTRLDDKQVRDYLYSLAESDPETENRNWAAMLLAIGLTSEDPQEVGRIEALRERESDPAIREIYTNALKNAEIERKMREEAAPEDGPK